MLYYCEFVLGSKPKSFEKRRIFQASEQCCVTTERGREAWFFFNLAAPPPISLQSFTRQRASAVQAELPFLFISAANNFHLHRFVLANGQEKSSELSQLFHLHSAVKSPSISLAPHCSECLTWGGEGSTSSTASHLSSPQGTAALAYWLIGNVPPLLCAIDQL